MNLAAWADRNGVARVTAYWWLQAGGGPSSVGGSVDRVDEPTEIDDDLVRDMIEILTSMCARLYRKRAAQNRAMRALAVAASVDAEAA